MTETTRGVLALISYALYTGAAFCAWRGWLAALPNSARRYRWRLRTWLLIGAGFAFSFVAFKDRHWWDWIGGFFVFVLVMDGCKRWWNATEKARQIERKFGVTL